MKSFALLRTNVGLTTNNKIIVDSNYNLFMESIESHSELAKDKYKKKQFNKNNYFDELVPYFFGDLSSEIAFSVKYSQDVSIMSNDFANQYDEIYNYGARNIINNKNYSEEFEYFAPLYISPGNLPQKFILFRIDGAGFENNLFLSRDNFKTEVINKLKSVKIFDLTKTSPLGEWIETNFKNNSFFPKTPLEIDFRPLEFSRWNGIDYFTGGYISKSLFLDDYFGEEKEIFGLEKWITERWKQNAIVFPNIINFSFLFDDNPATSDIERKWSINRYYGFYIDEMVQTQTISPYITPLLRQDTEIQDGNILFSPTGGDDGYPFVEKFDLGKEFWVEWRGNYFKVEKFTETLAPTLTSVTKNKITRQVQASTSKTRWRIISSENLTGKQSELNKNFGYIDSNNFLLDYDNNYLEIQNFSDADVWMIEIDGNYHTIVKVVEAGITKYKINSDWTFTYSLNEYSYKVAGKETKVSTIVDSSNPPKYWKVFKLNFTDIKDFDTRFIDTEYSKYEYEWKDQLTNTDETKMYLANLDTNSFPKPIDDYIWKGKVENIPCSSEYTANHETFKIDNGSLSSIWRKNPIHSRWVFQNSLSANDYPYLLNNSDILEDWNRTTNTIDPDPKRIERNLDYFYTINSSTHSYIHHSLHVEKLDSSENIDSNFKFELDKYLNLATYSLGTSSATWSFDYFNYFFNTRSQFSKGDIVKNVKKYSKFNAGDKYTPNFTLFRGIKFYAWDLDSIKVTKNGDIESVNLKNSNTFDDWKFTILLSDNDHAVDSLGNLIDSNNTMQWKIISEWKMEQTYNTGDIVSFDDMLWTVTSLTDVVTDDPVKVNNITLRTVKTAPHNQSGWTNYYTPYTPLWSPNKIYSFPSSNICDYVVWNNDTYWKLNTGGTVDFWNPAYASNPGYALNQVVLYKSQFWKSMTSSNSFAPDNTNGYIFNANKTDWVQWWQPTTTTQSRWTEIPIWNPSVGYTSGTTIVHNGVVWENSLNTLPDNEPGVSTTWLRKLSIEPDTDYIYTPTDNPVIRMNNKYYLNTSNSNNSTLDNGIIIYINKKWKNILININIADNTIPDISENDRDALYTDLNKKLTANNFINAINDIKGKYGFTDHVSYVVIDESGQIKKYNYLNNLTNLPFMITCEGPETLSTKINSLVKRPIKRPSLLKPLRGLNNLTINSLDELNYYNSGFVATEINENKFSPKLFENYHGNKNFQVNRIYRFSGYYMPLFYSIQLFKRGEEFISEGNFVFDTTLTEFGVMKERVISKVNRKGSILRLKDTKETTPIYPMLDEVGYSVVDFFIFASTWQFGYHYESSPNPQVTVSKLEVIDTNTEVLLNPGISPISQPEILITLPEIGQPINIQNLNNTRSL